MRAFPVDLRASGLRSGKRTRIEDRKARQPAISTTETVSHRVFSRDSVGQTLRSTLRSGSRGRRSSSVRISVLEEGSAGFTGVGVSEPDTGCTLVGWTYIQAIGSGD
jgi:hypothetical protein